MTISPVARTSTLLTGAALVTISGVAFATPAAASTITVTDSGGLYGAITLANSTPGPDTIVLGGTGFPLTIDLPIITSDLTITGPGSGSFTIDAANFFRAFDAENAPAVTLSGFTLINTDTVGIHLAGVTTIDLDDVVIAGPGSPVACGLEIKESGGTISNSSFNTSCGTLTVHNGNGLSLAISDSDFSGNPRHGFSAQLASSTLSLTNVTANNNGSSGIDIDAGEASVVTITGGKASDNGTVDDSPDGNNGYDIALGDTSSATITGITASGNVRAGIRLSAQSTGPVALSNIVSTGNETGLQVLDNIPGSTVVVDTALVAANSDVGVSTYSHGGTTSLSKITVIDNPNGGITINGDGGAQVSITDSTSARNGNPDSSVGGVFIKNPAMFVTITRTTISGNNASRGGGIFSGGQLTLVNSTISGNTSYVGAGMFVIDGNPSEVGRTTISHTTITENTNTVADYPVVLVDNSVNDTVTISHTIIAGNSGTLDFASPESTAIDYSLVGTPGAESLVALNAGAGNIIGKSPQLGPLADNGGLTQTHLPLPGSPVINAGNPAVSGAPATDQRGQQRIVRVIDMGSVEVTDVPPTTGPTTSSTLPATGLASDSTLPLAALALLLLGGAFAAITTLRRRGA